MNTIECPMCNDKIISSDFKSHLIYRHNWIKLQDKSAYSIRYSCAMTNCNLHFETAAELKEHQTKKYSMYFVDPIEVYKCESGCDKVFKTVDDFKIHQKENHTHMCRICEHICISKPELEEHQARAHNIYAVDKRFEYQCRACNKLFYQVSELKTHEHAEHYGVNQQPLMVTVCSEINCHNAVDINESSVCENCLISKWNSI